MNIISGNNKMMINIKNPSKKNFGGKLVTFLLILCLETAMTSCACRGDPAASKAVKAPRPKRILILGNSYVDFNGGIDSYLREMAPNTVASRIAPGGYTLKRHWSDPNTLNTIRSGGWDMVVLQEQSQTPVSFQADFFGFAKELDAEIKKAGAETVLFMTWERPDSIKFGVTTENLAHAYQALGQQLGAKVAPAGIAFSRALHERPTLNLTSQDGHPTIRGTYLAACVLYQTIFRQSPLGNSYPAGIPEEEKNFLQSIAARTD
jgi:hypothetical protein